MKESENQAIDREPCEGDMFGGLPFMDHDECAEALVDNDENRIRLPRCAVLSMEGRVKKRPPGSDQAAGDDLIEIMRDDDCDLPPPRIDGWVRLPRAHLKSRVWSADATEHWVFMWCVFRMNEKSRWFKGEEVPRGSFVTIRDKAASWLRLHPSRFRRILKKLSDWNVLAVKTVNNRYTLISVVDCEPYLEPEK